MNPADSNEVSKILQLLLNKDGRNDESVDSLDPMELNALLKARGGLQLVEQAVRQHQKQANESTLKNIAAETRTGETDVVESEEIKDRIGRFEIIRELGRGGFGVVLLARDPRLERRVALKIPNESTLENPEALSRFEREAQSAAMLGHPNIIPIFESGSIGPIKYIAFEYCEGESLASWLKQNQPTLSQQSFAKIIGSLAEAVQHAHSRGVVHRDLKPGNILIDRAGGLEKGLRITDFGLSKLYAADQSLTRTGATIGTPAYMSPEQARGDNNDVGPSTDIYSLGAILYELLAGRPPFSEENNLKTLQAIESKSPTRPLALNASASQDLQAICLKCLEKSPKDRYESASHLAADLQRFVAGEGVLARPIGSITRTWRWAKNNPLTSGSLAALGVGMAIATIVSSMFAMDAERSREDALVEIGRTRTVIQDLLVNVANEPAFQNAGMEKFRTKLLETADDYYTNNFAKRTADRELSSEHANVLSDLAKLFSSLGEPNRAIEIRGEAIELVNDLGDQKLFLDMADAQARDHSSIGRHDEAKKLVETTISCIDDLDMADEESQSLAFRTLVMTGQSMASNGRMEDARILLQSAKQIANSMFGDSKTDWPDTTSVGNWLALNAKIENGNADFPDSEFDELLNRAISIFEKAAYASPDDISLLEAKLANLYGIQSDRHLARGNGKELERSALNKKVVVERLVARHPDVVDYAVEHASVYFSLANALQWQQDRNGAIEYADAGLALVESLIDRFPERKNKWTSFKAEFHSFLAGVYIGYKGEKDQASYFEKAIDHSETAARMWEQLIEGPDATVKMKTDLARNYLALGSSYASRSRVNKSDTDYETAIGFFEKAIDLLESLLVEDSFGPVTRMLAAALYNYAQGLELKESGSERALAVLDDLIERFPNDTVIVRAKSGRNVTLARLGRFEEAYKSQVDLYESLQTHLQYDRIGQANNCSKMYAMSKAEDWPEGVGQKFLNFGVEIVKQLEEEKVFKNPNFLRLLFHPGMTPLKDHADFVELIKKYQTED